MSDARRIDGLIFDKDGTLFDFQATWAVFTRALVLNQAGGDSGLRDRLAAALGFDMDTGRFTPGSLVIAEPIDVIARAVLTTTGGGDLAALIVRMDADSAAVPQQPAADLVPLMTRLRDAGLTLGVVTNDGAAAAARHLALAGLTDAMRFVAGYDSGHGAKPDPGPLRAFCRATGIAAERCAMIGDSPHDLIAGRAAGMTCVGVLTGPARRADLLPLADVVLDSIADLPRWLGLAY